ncbi:hypothetical protein [Methyloversatilis universalis]|nr:hypothetical protein [Methyloversatilis universalis]
MLIEADERIRDAASNVDYVAAILLAGAVAYIVFPILEEDGVIPVREVMAKLDNLFEGRLPGSKKTNASDFLVSYNALKHTGGRGRGAASENLEVEMCLYSEAVSIMEDTLMDAAQLRPGDETRQRFKLRIQHLLTSDLYSFD